MNNEVIISLDEYDRRSATIAKYKEALAEIEELAEDEESAPEWVRERISDIAQEALKGDPNNDRTTNPNRNNR